MTQLPGFAQVFQCPQRSPDPDTPCDLHYRHGYLQSLPAREYLPIFWQDDELSMLQGTELDGKANADRYFSLSVTSLACIAQGGPCNLFASYACSELHSVITIQASGLCCLYLVQSSVCVAFCTRLSSLAEKHAREIIAVPYSPSTFCFLHMRDHLCIRV